MRLLIVNPNTSAGVTARIAAAAQTAAGPGERFTTVSALSGPPLIVTEADAVAATAGVLAAFDRHGAGVDGVILASFGDTGAEALRARAPDLPVIGIAEAAFGAARAIGGQTAIVTFAPEVVPSLLAKAAQHGMGDRLARVACVPGPLGHDPDDVADALLPELRTLCRACAADGAASIILGGGPLAGVAQRLAADVKVPLIDGTAAAVTALRARIAADAAAGG
jgi:Asp/Glu/hydantoin racemase